LAAHTSGIYEALSIRVAALLHGKGENSLIHSGFLGAVFFGIVLLTRIPFRSQILYHWDSVNFAYALKTFDITKDQPQPPGYILYVWLSRLVDLLLRDPQKTLVGISIVASALAVVTVFYFGTIFINRSVGLISASLLASSPLFWFYGELALPHVLDCFLVLLCVSLLYRVMRGETGYLYPCVGLLAVTGGVRQQTLVFLLPLAIFAFRRLGWKSWVGAVSFGIGACTIWFIPLIVLSGGLINYVRVLAVFSDTFQRTTSVLMGAGLPGVFYNLKRLAAYTGFAWNLAVIPALLIGAKSFVKNHGFLSREKLVFLMVWTAPSLFFYIFIHMGQQGLIFIFLPALLIISAAGLKDLLHRHKGRILGATAILVAVNTFIFCWGPEYPLGPQGQRLLTRETISASDAYFQDRFTAIQKNFPEKSTVILAANWHHVEYYLPNYRVVHFSTGAGENPISDRDAGYPLSLEPGNIQLHGDADGRMFLVVFDPILEAATRNADVIQSIALPNGGNLGYMAWVQGDELKYGSTQFRLDKQLRP